MEGRSDGNNIWKLHGFMGFRVEKLAITREFREQQEDIQPAEFRFFVLVIGIHVCISR